MEIDLSSNKLNGGIPEGLGTLVKLTRIALYLNKFDGTIPGSIGLLPNLQWIQMWNNIILGEVLPKLGKHLPLPNFEVTNNLSGSHPENLCANGELFNIVVVNNKFSGERLELPLTRQHHALQQ